MRKLLLTSAATFGAVLVTAGGAHAQPVKPIADPGTIVVHINGYLQFEIGGYGSSYNNVRIPGPTGGTDKLNPISTDGDVRIYPGFDGETRGGLNYGVQVETRITTSNASRAVGSNSTSANGTSSVYVRRAYGYVGTPEGGYGRFGQTDSAFSLLQAGAIQTFGDGGQFNDDGGPDQILPSAAVPGQFIYADQGALYATDKIVYLSPAIAGVSFGVGYEPNSNGLREGYANNAIASSTSAALTTSYTPGDIGTRRRNTVDAAVQYAATQFGAKIKISGGVLHSAPISYSGPAFALGTSPLHFGYDEMNVYQAGAQATYAGLTLGANIKAGAVEDSYGFKPRGGRNALAYIVGASYVIGPVVVGASYFNGQSSGAYYPGVPVQITGGGTVAKTLSEYGVAVGANYVVAKQFSLFLQYLYGHKHQPGVAFGGTTTVGAVKTANGSFGNAQVQLIAAGATFKW